MVSWKTVGGALAKDILAEGPAGYKGAMSETQQHYDETVVKAMANKEKIPCTRFGRSIDCITWITKPFIIWDDEGDYTAQAMLGQQQKPQITRILNLQEQAVTIDEKEKIADKMAAIADHFETQDKRASREMQIQTITHRKKI